MTASKIKADNGAFDEDGALHISGLDVIESTTRSDWPGVTFKGAPEPEDSVPRAHVTCPKCASTCPADAEVCWNCGAKL
ncbi:hypothetical protein [Adlercreutzia sp. ZJ242]|uniref:hypothetical protein n=1 Tax=Adlercreutzia sp. ZJ242 TaxID=2709409 RepID=UPI0013EAF4D3|nr:hypothetical protein [Adlercreutzia sp. ZJ242]